MATVHAITWEIFHILQRVSFLLQGQNHIYPLSIVWGKSLFSCFNAVPTLVLIPQAKCYHQSPTNIQCLTMVSQRGFVGENVSVPYKTKIYNNEFPVCHHLLFLPIHILYTPSSSLSLRNEEIWLASDLLCPVQVSIQHVKLSKPFQTMHICVCTCVLCAAVPVITLLSWRYRGLYLCCLSQDNGCNYIYTCKINVTQAVLQCLGCPPVSFP